LTYNQIDLNQIEIYSGDPDEEPDTGGGAFTYLDYSNVVWVSGECDNHGHWDYEEGSRLQMMSYDIDSFFSGERTKTYNLSTMIVKDGGVSYNLDAIVGYFRSKKYGIASYLQKLKSKPYNIQATVEKLRTSLMISMHLCLMNTMYHII